MTDPRRHVAHVVRSDSFAGVERYICNVSTELARRGWQVDVIGGEPVAMRRTLPPEVRYSPARTTAQVFDVLRRGGGHLPLVHTHMTAAEVAGVLARPLLGNKVVTTRHFAERRGSSPLVRGAGRLLSAFIHREVAISSYVAAQVGGSPVVLLNGVPDAPESPGVGSARTVLVLQRLQVEKDTATAVRAFAVSGLASQGWRLVIGGRGALEHQLRDLVLSLGMSDHVTMVGFVDEPARLRESAAIFLASAPQEPFGLSVAEAMASGLPVVAADGGAHAEVLGGTGLLFAPGDEVECAERLRRLAADPELRRGLGRRGLERQRRALSISAHVDVLDGLYRDVIGTPSCWPRSAS